jgi:hypothetical protein
MAMMKLLSLHTISSRLGVWESEAVMVYAKRQNRLVSCFSAIRWSDLAFSSYLALLPAPDTALLICKDNDFSWLQELQGGFGIFHVPIRAAQWTTFEVLRRSYIIYWYLGCPFDPS